MRSSVYPHADRFTLLWFVLAVAILGALVGCGPSAAVERLVEIETAAHDADLAEWEKLTPEQRKQSVRESRASWYEVRRSLFDKPVPEDLK